MKKKEPLPAPLRGRADHFLPSRTLNDLIIVHCVLICYYHGYIVILLILYYCRT